MDILQLPAMSSSDSCLLEYPGHLISQHLFMLNKNFVCFEYRSCRSSECYRGVCIPLPQPGGRYSFPEKVTLKLKPLRHLGLANKVEAKEDCSTR